MNHKSLRLVAVAGALLISACMAASASAQCCGWGGGWGTTANYAPAYQTYDTGWYPGYWWNRVSARLWGSPSTYVAAYPGYHTAGYAGYAGYSGYSGYSGCSTCSAGYAPACTTCASPCTTCASPCTACASPCSSCSTCTAGYAPSNTYGSSSNGYSTSYAPTNGGATYGSSCPSNCGCATYANGSGATQTSYSQPSQQPGCNCGAHTTTSPPSTYVSPPAAAPAPTPAAPPTSGAAQAPPATGGLEPKPDYDANRPVEMNAPANGVQPGPGSEAEEKKVDPYEVKKTDSGAYFEAPKLFNPKDRQARSTSIAPVRTAVYEQPVSYRQTSSAPRGPITAEQARQDAIGWASGAK